MVKMIENKLSELLALCRRHHVAELYLFGSATGRSFGAGSDVDFLVSFEQGLSFVEYADNYFELADALERLLGRSVDLVTEKSLSNPYFIESVEKTKQLLYVA